MPGIGSVMASRLGFSRLLAVDTGIGENGYGVQG